MAERTIQINTVISLVAKRNTRCNNILDLLCMYLSEWKNDITNF